jgi:hypothetical protein
MYKRSNDVFGFHLRMNEMTINFDVFGSFVEDWITSNMNSYLVVTIKRCWTKSPNSCRIVNKVSSQVV